VTRACERARVNGAYDNLTNFTSFTWLSQKKIKKRKMTSNGHFLLFAF